MHWGWYKMAAILQRIFSNVFSWMKITISIQIELCIPKGAIDNKSLARCNGLVPTRWHAIITLILHRRSLDSFYNMNQWGPSSITRICLNLLIVPELEKIFHAKHPGRVLTLWKLLHMLRHVDPLFSGPWKICIASTRIFEQKCGKCRISTLIFVKI